MKKRMILVLFALLTAGVSIFHGNTAISADTIELKLATFIPPGSTMVNLYQDWGKEIEKLTSGRVKVTVYAGGSLVGYPDMYPSVISGVADITTCFASSVPEFSFESLYNLPMLGWKSENMLDIRREMEKEFPAIKKGRSEVKTLFLNQVPNYTLHLAKDKAVRVPDDIKGMKLRCTDAGKGFTENCGAAAVFLGPPDWYMSLEKGVINGLFVSYDVLGSERLDEVTKTHVNVPSGTSASATVMNLNKWEKLPADIQKIIGGTLGEWEEKIHATQLADERKTYEKIIASPDHKVTDLTEKELALWKEKAIPSHEEWIKNMEKKGFPARAAYDKLNDIIARHK
jgi:TRAP-type C4-dicarboxylate transport system substrate-binding protein